MDMATLENKWKGYFFGIGHPANNIQWKFKFPNGYGASVIFGPNSYGSDEGLYELALIEWADDEHYHLAYHDCVQGDVLGYLTIEDIDTMLTQIMSGRIDDQPDIYKEDLSDH